MKRFLLSLFSVMTVSVLMAQNVGIGTTSPHNSAMLDITSTSRGLLVPRMSTAQRLAIAGPTQGLIVYDLSDRQFWIYNSGGWQAILDLSDKYWFKSLASVPKIYTQDSISVGSTSLFEKMNLTDGSFYMRDNRTSKNPHLIFEVPNTDLKEGGIQFKQSNNGDTLAAINYIHNNSIGNYLRVGLSNTGISPDLVVHSSGRTGIGILDPQVKLHVRSSADDELLRLDGLNPMIKLRRRISAFPLTFDDVGFLQTSGTDIRIGTFSGNTTGSFVIRMNNSDQVFVDAGGDVGIGSTVPITKLQIEGGQDAGLTSNNNGYIMLGSNGSGNLILDNNEIMARTGLTTAATLTLQNDGGDLRVGPNNLYVEATGNVGIGTASPAGKLHVTGRLYINNGSNQALGIDGSNPFIQFYHNGTARSYIQNTSDVNMTLAASGSIIMSTTNVGIGTATPLSRLNVSGTGNFVRLDGTNPGISFVQTGAPSQNSFISQSNPGTGPELFIGVNNGNLHLDAMQVAIGSVVTAASAYKLAVTGKIICEEVKVKLVSSGWPDYVFADDYRLRPLTEVERFIQQNKHLPNIPSAAEVEKNGIEVGDMQKRMMEKIEELTLYIIELQKQVETLKKSQGK